MYNLTNLKTKRLAWNLTQKQLAEIIGVSESVISRWENGSRFPRFNMLVKIAEHFNLTIEQLLNDTYRR